MIGEQYKIKGVAQAEVLHHKKRLVNVHGTEPANKNRQFKAFCEDNIDMSRPGHVRGYQDTRHFAHEIKLHD